MSWQAQAVKHAGKHTLGNYDKPQGLTAREYGSGNEEGSLGFSKARGSQCQSAQLAISCRTQPMKRAFM